MRALYKATYTNNFLGEIFVVAESITEAIDKAMKSKSSSINSDTSVKAIEMITSNLVL